VSVSIWPFATKLRRRLRISLARLTEALASWRPRRASRAASAGTGFSMRRLASIALPAEFSGWASSCARVAAIVPIALSREACISSAWARFSSSSERFCSVMSR
jgi:hypothetical protein